MRDLRRFRKERSALIVTQVCFVYQNKPKTKTITKIDKQKQIPSISIRVRVVVIIIINTVDIY